MLHLVTYGSSCVTALGLPRSLTRLALPLSMHLQAITTCSPVPYPGALLSLRWVYQATSIPYAPVLHVDPQFEAVVVSGQITKVPQHHTAIVCSRPITTVYTLNPQFETMVVSGQIKELRCFYDHQKRVFYSVVELGK